MPTKIKQLLCQYYWKRRYLFFFFSSLMLSYLNPSLEGFGITLDFHQFDKIRILSCLNKWFKTIFPNGSASTRYRWWKAAPFVCLPGIWLCSWTLFLKPYYEWTWICLSCQVFGQFWIWSLSSVSDLMRPLHSVQSYLRV